MEFASVAFLVVPLIMALIWFLLPTKSSKHLIVSYAVVYLLVWAVACYMWFTGVQSDTQLFLLDEHTLIFVMLIFVLSFLISRYARNYFGTEMRHGAIEEPKLKEYLAYSNLFIFSMVFAAISKNLMLSWVALEATTIFTTFLISFYGKRTSREAAWKYVIICWIGLTIGLLGLFMLIYAGINTLDYTAINPFAEINVNLVKFAFLFVFVGVGTKVGFFPLHTWLPDAHGKWSTPISAFMSSILLPLALFFVYNTKGIVDTMLWSTEFTSWLFILFALLTIGYVGVAMIVQRHMKRALAYSSSENMWILALALGLGTPLAMKLFVIHLIGHSFLKSAAFMSVGSVLINRQTGRFENLSHILKDLRVSGILLIVSLILLVGLPIWPLFFTEVGIALEAFKVNPRYAVVFMLGIVGVFAGILYNFSKIFLAKDGEEETHHDTSHDTSHDTIGGHERLQTIHRPIILCLVLGIATSLLFFVL